jgi:hypothetical protein
MFYLSSVFYDCTQHNYNLRNTSASISQTGINIQIRGRLSLSPLPKLMTRDLKLSTAEHEVTTRGNGCRVESVSALSFVYICLRLSQHSD